MPVLQRIFICLCILGIVTVGASAAPTKPAPSSGGNGTIYFLRPTPIMGWATKPDIKLDGRLVGELSVGSYLVVSCPRGQHSISVRGGGLEGGFETQLQVESGKSYFIEVGPNQNGQAIGQQLIGRIISNSNFGQQMPGSTLLAVYVFYQLSAEEGRTKIATLKKIGR